MGYGTVRYGLFIIGLLVAGVSFLVYVGNALTLEGRRDSIETLAILGMLAGSSLAGLGMIMEPIRSRRFIPLAVVIMGGMVAAAGGRLLGSLCFMGGNSSTEWLLAVCLAPLGMWLGWLGSGSSVAVAASIGGTGGALLAAAASPVLFNRAGPPANNPFWALSGLLLGGIVGTLLGAFLGRRRHERKE